MIVVAARFGSAKTTLQQRLKSGLTSMTQQTAPLIARYQARGLVTAVNGDQAIERVTDEIVRAIKQRVAAV